MSGLEKPQSGFDLAKSEFQIPFSRSDLAKSGSDIPRSGFQIPLSGFDITMSDLHQRQLKAGLVVPMSCFWNGMFHLFASKAVGKRVDGTGENSFSKTCWKKFYATR
jgi:hypothetical protein